MVIAGQVQISPSSSLCSQFYSGFPDPDSGQKQDTGDGGLHNEGLDTLWPVTDARIADHPVARVDALLPWNWKPEHRPPAAA